jgi:hypothetical protein
MFPFEEENNNLRLPYWGICGIVVWRIPKKYHTGGLYEKEFHPLGQ